MAKRDEGPARPADDTTTSASTTPDALQRSVVAFAQQLGRIAGTLQSKAEGLMNRDAVNREIADVRDGAADLLGQLSAAASRVSAVVKTPTSKETPAPKAAAKPARTSAKSGATSAAKGANSAVKGAPKKAPASAPGGVSKGRSGGMVDAPGKKHRKPPANPDKHLVSSQAAKMRAAMPMEKTTKRRGRG